MSKSTRWMSVSLLALTAAATSSCSMAPDFKLPHIDLPGSYKEEPVAIDPAERKGEWKPAVSLVKEDRGEWWKIFGDEQLNALEKQAAEANQSLKAAAARIEEARSNAGANRPSILPNVDIGANAVRAQPSNASLAAFGGLPGTQLKPYTLYDAQGVVSYEADLFGRVRDNYKAFVLDADAQQEAYRTALLALQADVAQTYFALRAMDTERQLLRDTVKIRAESARITEARFKQGEAAFQDNTRAQSDYASVQADLLGLDRQRAGLEHALAVLLGKMPSEFTFAETLLTDAPPAIPAGLPSTLLERRPDVATAQAYMAAANLRVGAARTAFFPRLILTASGGFESTDLGDLFKWSSRTWALGQLANTALSMPIFDSGRNQSRLDFAKATYDESVANYRQSVLVAFRDVEDNLANQRILAAQSVQADLAADAGRKTTELTQRRYQEGDVNFFEVVTQQRDSLTAERIAVQLRGQRFITTVALIRALGGGWEVPEAQKPVEETPVAPTAAEVVPVEEKKPEDVKPVEPVPAEKTDE